MTFQFNNDKARSRIVYMPSGWRKRYSL